MTDSVPFIPENAPFTQEQRAWLNGLLAGLLYASKRSADSAVRPSLRVAVLFASQSGTAEGLARKIAKELKAQGHQPAVSTLVGYSSAALASEKYALIIASTYGDGEAPDGVQPFYEQLCAEHFPRFENLSYAVLALGDRHYEQFCQFGKDLDSKLASLGANRLCDRADSDVDVTGPFEAWKATVVPRLNEIASRGVEKSTSISVPVSVAAGESHAESLTKLQPVRAISYNRENPAFAPIVEKRNLTSGGAQKATLHLAFSIRDLGMHYEAGDACGVLPSNSAILVAEILQVLKFNGNEQVQCGKAGVITLHEALSHHLHITRLTRKMLADYSTRGSCSMLLDLLKPGNQQQLEAYLYGRGLIDMLVECPGVIEDPSELVAMLPRLSPRLYSISSSPAAHEGQIHTTVAVVRFTAHNRERGGVCSTYFADHAEISDRLPIYIQPNKKFRLPEAGTPIIMIGPGTGIAPFRGFLHERRMRGASGPNWLFFGAQHADKDFLYREELEAMLADGHLARLDTAFSRDQSQKIYVQDRMLEQGQLFWNWLQDGASVYVCGDASRMAKDVDAALHQIVQKQGQLSPEAAEEYVGQMKESHRYHRDVY